MNRTLVIADDLTGAAEIAGIATRYGLATVLHRAPADVARGDVVVLDTDSRSMPSERAIQRVRALLERVRTDEFRFIYKKTDSVLRGNVRAEIEAVLEATGRSRAMFIPQNPSRGRTIAGGVYRINGVPLDQTPFAHDPDHPAKTAIASEILGPTQQIDLLDADSLDDITRAARKLQPTNIAAGGADFFEAALSSWHGFSTDVQSHGLKTRATENALFICGSTSTAAMELAKRHHLPVIPMPQNVFDGHADLTQWARQILDSLKTNPYTMATIGRSTATGKAAHLSAMLAELAAKVLSERSLPRLCLEGGATAAAICDRMQWTSLRVIGEVTPGVVMVQPDALDAPELVVKPGSYPWPEQIVGSALADRVR